MGAGLVHGMYTTGGPLLVYALGREGLSKHVFRSTVTAVWLVFNVGLRSRSTTTRTTSTRSA
jgi:hypothetical protein